MRTSARERDRARATSRVAAIACALVAAVPASAADPAAGAPWEAVPARAPDPALEARIDALLARMSLDDKVAQMIQAEIQKATPDDVRAARLGSILNGAGSFPNDDERSAPPAWRALAERYRQASLDRPSGSPAIPILWATDAVHGHNNVHGTVLFPHNIGLGAADDPALTEAIGAATAADMRSTGIVWAFAPTVAIADDPRWGRTYESFGEDPALVRRHAFAYVRGLQGGSPDGRIDGAHVVATAKHFLADGGTRDGIDQGSVTVDEATLATRHAQGYYGALEAGVQAVMVSYVNWRGSKLHGDRHFVTEVLKERLGFDGVVVSDWGGIGQVPGCSDIRCPVAINAGVDVLMAADRWRELLRNTQEDARRGTIPRERIDDAVRRILRVKLRAGLFAPTPSPTPDVLATPERRELARRAVRESLVLLKNRAGLLPLSPSARVLVAGDGADSVPRQAGGWSLGWQRDGRTNADFPAATTIGAGIAAAVRAGGGSVELRADGRYRARPDVAVVVFGEAPYAEAYGDRRDLGWSTSHPRDVALLRRLKAAGIPVVSVLLTGRPLWTNPEINASDAFVVAWLPGTEGGGVADLLFRPAAGQPAYEFAGRLPFRWPNRALPPRADHADDVAFPAGFGLHLDPGRDAPHLVTVAERALPEDSGLGEAERRSLSVVFDGAEVSPWRVFAGDGGGWRAELIGPRVSSPLGHLELERATRDDGTGVLRGRWSGRGEAAVYAEAGGFTDWSAALARRGRVAFDLKRDSAPPARVKFGQECHEYCEPELDVTKAFAAAPQGRWTRISIDLRCMVRAGLNPRLIASPFSIMTRGPLDASIGNVRLETDGPGPATVECDGPRPARGAAAAAP
jgi:beta-glucosidase